MQTGDATDLAGFRDQVRRWVRAHLRQHDVPASAQERAAHTRALQRGLFEAGLAGLSIPKEYGGRGLGSRHERIFAEEVARSGHTWRGIGTSLGMLLAHGSEEMRRRHIPAMLGGDEVWVQLLSESAAGSDLAGLVTVAEPVEGGYVITGEKMWISHAEFADYGSCLARSDPHAVKNRGLTMFVVGMRDPRVMVRPIRTCAGSTEFCEVFLDHVPVARTDILGEVGLGWAVATTGREQRNASGNQGRSDVPAAIARGIAERARGGAVDTRSVDLVAQAWVRQVVQGQLEGRVRARVARSALPGAGTALVKLGRTWRDQANATAALEALGLDGVFWTYDGADVAIDYLEQRTRSVSGGTSEIQLNIVAERVLALPKEPRTDLHQPFDRLPSNVPLPNSD